MSLATYLNDHLAGSTAALELLERLEQLHPEIALSLKALRHDIEGSRAELEALIDRVGATRGPVKQAAAWVAEKAAWLKMLAANASGGGMSLLEALEAVAVGIHGQGSLWRALKVVPAAAGLDYDELAARADDQRARIELLRLDAARAALT